MTRESTQTPAGAEAKLPAAETVNPAGAAPLLLTCDHAGRALPPAYGTLGLDEVEFWRHIAWDIGAADITRRLASHLDAPAVLSIYSRLLIDCNRAEDDPTLICEISDGTAVPGNRNLGPAEKSRRLALFHAPYHDAVAAALRRQLAAHADTAVALISIHSFTPVMKGIERPWHIGILWNRDGRIAQPLLQALREERDLVIGDNQPYSGQSGVGYTTRRHAESAGLPHVLIEIRQDLIDTHRGAEMWAQRVAAALRKVLAANGRFSIVDAAS